MKLILASLVAALAFAQSVGVQPDGRFLLATGWSLKPAGRQIPVGSLPLSSALTKDGKHLMVLNVGDAKSLTVFRTDTMQQVAQAALQDAWLGLAIAPDGKSVFIGGAARASVLEYAFSSGKLDLKREISVVVRGKPAANDFVGDVAVSPDSRLLYAANVFGNAVHVINLQSGRAIERWPTGRRPYRLLLHPDGKSFVVSSWVDGSIYHQDAASGERLGLVRLGQHPTDMLWRKRKAEENADAQKEFDYRLFVAAAHTNNVFVVGFSESKTMRNIESIHVGLTPRHPLGMTPSALAMSADQSRLYVACSDANALAVVDVSEPSSNVVGFVPTGSYPTSVAAFGTGALAILNGRGAGTMSIVSQFDDDQLITYSDTVRSNSPFRDELMSQTLPPSSIKNVVYVVKDPGNAKNPVFQSLAQQFVRFNNFHAAGAGPIDGFNWSASAIVPDFVQKLGYRSAQFASDVAALPQAGTLWTNAASAGISQRAYIDSTLGATFVRDLTQAGSSDAFPRLAVVRLTAPAASSDDVDRALGNIVDAVSKSPRWSETAIFVLATSGPEALIISPLTKTGKTDSSFYSTLSMLRTMELFLGLRPMTHFDGAAKPMLPAFSTWTPPTP
jgi:DNA-binding beta-propeller fold protein YncE